MRGRLAGSSDAHAQKKWPASVALQASKKSKGLQEQQSQPYSNTLRPQRPSDIHQIAGIRSGAFGQLTGEKIQSKGRIRKSLVFETLPCQPQRGLSQTISSSPKIFIASFSESAGLEHFRCKLILCPPLGHAKTIL
jgi:hypothetical protein